MKKKGNDPMAKARQAAHSPAARAKAAATRAATMAAKRAAAEAEAKDEARGTDIPLSAIPEKPNGDKRPYAKKPKAGDRTALLEARCKALEQTLALYINH